MYKLDLADTLISRVEERVVTSDKWCTVSRIKQQFELGIICRKPSKKGPFRQRGKDRFGGFDKSFRLIDFLRSPVGLFYLKPYVVVARIRIDTEMAETVKLCNKLWLDYSL